MSNLKLRSNRTVDIFFLQLGFSPPSSHKVMDALYVIFGVTNDRAVVNCAPAEVGTNWAAGPWYWLPRRHSHGGKVEMKEEVGGATPTESCSLIIHPPPYWLTLKESPRQRHCRKCGQKEPLHSYCLKPPPSQCLCPEGHLGDRRYSNSWLKIGRIVEMVKWFSKARLWWWSTQEGVMEFVTPSPSSAFCCLRWSPPHHQQLMTGPATVMSSLPLM